MLLRTYQQPHWIEEVERGFHCGGDCLTFGGTTALRRFGELVIQKGEQQGRAVPTLGVPPPQ